MGNAFYFQWEVELMEWLQAFLGETGTSIMGLFTTLGDGLFMVIFIGFIYWSFNKQAGEYIGTSLVVSLVWNPMIKNLTLRRRPYFDNPGIKCLKPAEADADIYDIAKQGFSFPSGHSCNSATVYGSLARFFKKNWLTAVCILLPFLVGISRVCVGAHYPTDVLGGWLLGAITLFLVPFISRMIKSRIALYSLLVLSAVPGIFYCRTTDYFSGLGMMLGFFTGICFEKKYVHFENTTKPLSMALRVICGALVFLAIDVLIELPFSSQFLESESAACFALRVFRYAVIMFVELGVYPMVFKKKAFK